MRKGHLFPNSLTYLSHICRFSSSVKMSKHSVLLRNGQEAPWQSKDDLLQKSSGPLISLLCAYQTGVYTTARTIDQTFVMEFDAHVARMGAHVEQNLA